MPVMILRLGVRERFTNTGRPVPALADRWAPGPPVPTSRTGRLTGLVGPSQELLWLTVT